MIEIPNKWFFINESSYNVINLFNNNTNRLGIIFLYNKFSTNVKYKRIEKHILKIIRQKKIPFFVYGSFSLAINLKANGLFLPIEKINCNSYNITKARNCFKKLMIGTTIHSKQEMILSKKYECDITFVSPAYKTNTHKNIVPLSTVRFIYLCHLTKNYKFALGGVNEKNYSRLKNKHLKGFGGINYFKKLN